MSVGVLIITHYDLGAVLLDTATRMLADCPLACKILEVSLDSNLEHVQTQAKRLTEELNQGEGVLVLTDMFGSTPSNIASGLCRDGQVAVVAGLNLPMLVRIFNYPQLDLDSLKDKALSGGRDGVVPCGESR